MLFLVEPLTRSEQNTRRDHPITAPSHPAMKAIATTEHNVLTHPLKTPHNYPPLTPPLSKGCRYVSSAREPQPNLLCRGEASLLRSPSRAMKSSKSPDDARPGRPDPPTHAIASARARAVTMATVRPP